MGNSSSPKKSSGKKSSGKKGSKKAAAKKQRNRILLFVGEIVVLAVLVLVVWAVFTGTDNVEKINVEPEEVVS